MKKKVVNCVLTAVTTIIVVMVAMALEATMGYQIKHMGLQFHQQIQADMATVIIKIITTVVQTLTILLQTVCIKALATQLMQQFRLIKIVIMLWQEISLKQVLKKM